MAGIADSRNMVLHDSMDDDDRDFVQLCRYGRRQDNHLHRKRMHDNLVNGQV